MVFVIIPVFNSEKYLKECLDSVFAQTYKNIFVVCVNDGSTDSSHYILENYLKFDNYVILNKNNGGSSSARNFALNYIFEKYANIIRDSYFVFLDSDDVLSPHFINSYLKIIINTNSDIATGNVTCIENCFEDNGLMCVCEREEALLKLFKNEIFSFSCVKMYKAYLWESVRYPEDISLYEDVATIYKTFLNANKVAVLDCSLYFYRDNPDSILRKRITNKTAIGMQQACLLRISDINNMQLSLNNYNELFSFLLKNYSKTLLDTVWHIKISLLSDSEKAKLRKTLNAYPTLLIKKNAPLGIKYFIKYLKLKLILKRI